MSSVPIIRVALPTPLRRLFDYRADLAGPSAIVAGSRVRVPFGQRRLIGVAMETATSSELPAERLKPVLERLDPQPIFDPATLALLGLGGRLLPSSGRGGACRRPAEGSAAGRRHRCHRRALGRHARRAGSVHQRRAPARSAPAAAPGRAGDKRWRGTSWCGIEPAARRPVGRCARREAGVVAGRRARPHRPRLAEHGRAGPGRRRRAPFRRRWR